MSDPTITEKSLSSLFPTGNITWDGMEAGSMREMSDGLAAQKDRDRLNGKAIITDFFPYKTTLQKEWEEVFKLPTGADLTEDQRRDRLIASWTKKSTANFTEMNEIYALSGFNLVARPLEPGEDPRTIAATGNTKIYVDGRAPATSTNYVTKTGASRCGNISESSLCGAFDGTKIDVIDPIIPDDEWTWPLIYIIESVNGGPAFIKENQFDSFDFLTYKIKPNMMWAIARYELYTDTVNLINDDGENLINDDGENLVELE